MDYLGYKSACFYSTVFKYFSFYELYCSVAAKRLDCDNTVRVCTIQYNTIKKLHIMCSASDYAYNYTFLRSVVCLSVVCHIHAPCLNRSTKLDAIWQIHLQGPMIHCARWGLWPLTPRGRGDLGSNQSQNMRLQIAAATWRIYQRGAIPPIVKSLWF